MGALPVGLHSEKFIHIDFFGWWNKMMSLLGRA